MGVAGVAGEGGGELVAAFGLLDRALDALTGVPFADLTPAAQASAVAGILRRRCRLEAIEATVVRAFDAGGEWALDGHRSPGAALAHRHRMPRAEAHHRVRLGRRLEEVPEVAAALLDGSISMRHAELLLAARRPEVAEVFDRDVGLLLEQAPVLSFAEFAKAVRYWSVRADPDGAEQRAEQVVQRRQAYVSRTVDDLVRVDAWLDPVGGSVFLSAVERIEDELFRADWAEAEAVHGSATTISHLARTASQRRADALVELSIRATAAPADGRRPLPLANVLVDEATFGQGLRQLLGLPAGPVPTDHQPQCELLDGTVITPGQAAALALAGHVRRVVYDSPNRISQISARKRFYTGTARDVLEVRDRGCTHPGCDQPAWRCEGDHIEAWNGTNTTQRNGRLLCRYHHRLRQRLGDPPIVARRTDGTLDHRRADGTPIADPVAFDDQLGTGEPPGTWREDSG